MKPESEKPNGDKRHKSNVNEVREFAATNLNKVMYCLVALLDDFKNLLPHDVYSAAALARDKETIKNRVQSEGLTFATQTLPKLSEGLFQYLEAGSVNYPSFALDKHGKHPLFLKKLFALACRPCELQTEAIRYIYQISVLFSKLKGPYPESVLRKQLADFVRVDKELAELDLFDEVNFPILEQARQNINDLFFGSDIIRESKPRPGPGGTNTPVPKHLRYRPRVLYTDVDEHVPYLEYFLVNGYDSVHQTKFWLSLYNSKVKEPTSRQKFVHKKVGKARGICLEENEVQYLQQAFRHAIYDWIETRSPAKGRICFTDQSVNQRLALAGSYTGLLATLDESEASDRILRSLVSWLYQDLDFHDALMALSTRVIEFPKEFNEPPLRTVKYAPMGSALCFPIMATVHWALIKAIVSLTGLGSAVQEEIYVYGDDIIIPVSAVEAVLTYLPRFGMKLNKSKSFWRSGFRESCGVHAYNGVDITPVFVKHLPVTPSITFAMSCISCEQQLFELSYKNVAFLLRKWTEEIFGSLPFTASTSSVFGFKRQGHFFPITTGVVREKRDEYGNILYRFRSVKAIQEIGKPPSEYESYLRHALTKSLSREMAGTPSKFFTRWKYVTWPEACGIKQAIHHERPVVINDYLNLMEQKYDFYSQSYQSFKLSFVHNSIVFFERHYEQTRLQFGRPCCFLTPKGGRKAVRRRTAPLLRNKRPQ